MQGGNDPNSVPSDSLDGDELALFEADAAPPALCSVTLVQPETASTATQRVASLMFITTQHFATRFLAIAGAGSAVSRCKSREFEIHRTARWLL